MTSAYTNVGGSGPRGGQVGGIVAVSVSGGGVTGSVASAVDGDFTTTTTHSFFWASASAVGVWLQFDFLRPEVMDKIKLYQSSATAQGTWMLSGSNDNWATHTDLHSFVWSTATQEETFTNTTPFKAYRITGTAGSTSSSPWIEEIEFSLVSGAHAALERGSRSGSITVTTSSDLIASGTGGNPQNLVDGTETGSNGMWAVSKGVAGTTYVKWDFGATSVQINGLAWIAGVSSDAWATWTLQYWNGSAWVSVGPPITIGGLTTGGRTAAQGWYFANDKSSTLWRLLNLSGTTSSNGDWQIESQFYMDAAFPVAVTWNPNDKDSAITLSNGNATASTTGGDAGVRGTISHASGKWYIEYNNIAHTGGLRDSRGFATVGHTLNDQSATLAIGLGESGGFPGGTTTLGDVNGHTIQFAIDIDAGRYWVRLDGGTWAGAGASPDPATGTSGADYTGVIAAGVALYPYCVMLDWAGVPTTTINGGHGGFANAAPTGFSAWDPPQDYWHSVETPDVMSSSGYTGAFGTIGNLTSTEAKDIFAALGYQPVSFAMNLTEAADVFSAYGRQPLTMVWHSTEAIDLFHAVGVGRGVDGVFITSEAADIFAALGSVPISGTFITSEVADHFQAIGAGVTQVRRRRTRFVT